MRATLVVGLVGLMLGFSTVADAAPAPRHIVVILPLAANGDDDAFGLAMQARAVQLLVRTGNYQDVHAKQILRVAELEALSRTDLASASAAAVMLRRFGAERVVYGRLTRDKEGLFLSVGATPKAAAMKVKLPADPLRAFHEGALTLARLAAGGAEIPDLAPVTKSAPALTAYAKCYAVVVEQPLLVDTAVIIEKDRLQQAVKDCVEAVSSDDDFHDARAALGLALALSGQDDRAVETLAATKEGDGYLPLYWLARYWLVTRYESPKAGGIGLRAALDKHPYMLVARGLLAQHESAIHDDAAALAAWRDYQKELPKSAFVRGGISHSLARLGKHAEAIAEAKGAVADAPDDHEAKLELGSRYIDAGKYPSAVAVLKPLAETPKARAEVMLRLGWAYARLGDNENAVAWLTRAENNALRPSEWRTRARARLDRGVLLVKSGQVDEGQALLASAESGGLGRYIADSKDEELKKMVKDAAVAQAGKRVAAAPFEMQIPEETSPWSLDGAHNISGPGTGVNPPPTPKMFDVIRF